MSQHANDDAMTDNTQNNPNKKKSGGFLNWLFGSGEVPHQEPAIVGQLPSDDAFQSPRDDTAQAEPQLTLEDVGKQVKRLAREWYKTNALTESTLDEQKQALQFARQLVDDQQQQTQEKIQAARLELAKTLLPVVDAIEAGLISGTGQARSLLLTSPDAARMLNGWLEGQLLLRERLLKLLQGEGIYMMNPLKQPFDPYKHVVVKTAALSQYEPDIIVGVERPGYMHGDEVLRYAEVIVNKPLQSEPRPQTQTSSDAEAQSQASTHPEPDAPAAPQQPSRQPDQNPMPKRHIHVWHPDRQQNTPSKPAQSSGSWQSNHSDTDID